MLSLKHHHLSAFERPFAPEDQRDHRAGELQGHAPAVVARANVLAGQRLHGLPSIGSVPVVGRGHSHPQHQRDSGQAANDHD